MIRRISSGWAVALFGMAAAWAQSQTAPPTEQPATLTGVITNSLTGEPLLRAHVQLQLMRQGGPGNQAYGAMTNSEGKFSITKIPPGEYRMSMDRIGFVMLPNAPGNPNGPIQLAAGDAKGPLKLTMTPVGAITGRVLDAEGEPLQNVTVAAEGPNGNSGTMATTDDKGEYRIGGLRPGKYRVKATQLAISLPPEIRSDGTADSHYSPSYYPGVLTAASATRLQVQPAAQLAGTDIRLVRTPVVTVSGRVTGAPEGARNINIQMQKASTNGFNGSTGIQANPDGTFRLWRLDPGKYTVTATLYSAGAQSLRSAPVDVEVTTANIENLELRMVPPFEVRGEVRFDDEQARQAAQPPARTGQNALAPPPAFRGIMLRSASPANGPQATVNLGADVTFLIGLMDPGLYHVALSWSSAYVRSVRVGSTETDGDLLDLRNGPAGEVTISVSSLMAEVSGTATDSQGPLSGAMVVLLSDGDGRQFLRTATSGQDGTYTISDVPPGKYKLVVADDDFNMSAARNGNGLEDYADVAMSVEVHAGDHVSKDLKVKQK